MKIKMLTTAALFTVLSGCSSNNVQVEHVASRIDNLSAQVKSLSEQVEALKAQQGKDSSEVQEMSKTVEEAMQRINNFVSTYKK